MATSLEKSIYRSLTADIVATDTARSQAQSALASSGAAVVVDGSPTSTVTEHWIVIEAIGGESIRALNRPLGCGLANVDVVVNTRTSENWSDMEAHLDLVANVRTILSQASFTDGDITVHNVIPDLAFSSPQAPSDGSDAWVLQRTISFQIIYTDAAGLPDDVASF